MLPDLGPFIVTDLDRCYSFREDQLMLRTRRKPFLMMFEHVAADCRVHLQLLWTNVLPS